jgi:hypothetical protein
MPDEPGQKLLFLIKPIFPKSVSQLDVLVKINDELVNGVQFLQHVSVNLNSGVFTCSVMLLGYF